MSATDGKCPVQMRSGRQCGRPVLRNERCVFHLQQKTEAEGEAFWEALLKEKTKIESAESIDAIDWTGFRFPERTLASRLQPYLEEFKKHVFFTNSTFEGDIDFDRVQFSAAALFDNVTFREKASFEKTAFAQVAVFEDATFSKEADFSYARFHGAATFQRTEFMNNAEFIDVTFNSVNFGGARFSGEAFFFGAIFSRAALFNDAVFASLANFRLAKFSDVRFFDTIFLGNLIMGARFDGVAHFDKVVFQRDTIESSEFKGVEAVYTTEFEGASVGPYGEVRFIQPKESRRDLSVERNYAIDRVSFLNTDLSKFVFQDVEWGSIRSRIFSRKAVVEETIARHSDKLSAEHVIQVYTSLRRNLENALRYSEAGDFFIGEMEMKRMAQGPSSPGQSRKRRALNWFRRNISAISLYKLLSMYGESWHLLVAWIIVSVPLFALFRATYDFVYSYVCALQFGGVFVRYLTPSFKAFFQVKTDDLLDVVERIWSGVLLGLTYIALRRKLERHH